MRNHGWPSRSEWKQAANDAIEVVVAFVHWLNTVPEMGQLLSDLVHDEETMASLTGTQAPGFGLAPDPLPLLNAVAMVLRATAVVEWIICRAECKEHRRCSAHRPPFSHVVGRTGGHTHTEEQRRVAEMHHEEFKAGGTTLPQEARDRVVKLQMEVDRLRWEFSQNAHNCPVTEFTVPEFNVEDLPAGFR